jgi:hypothetical protein
MMDTVDGSMVLRTIAEAVRANQHRTLAAICKARHEVVTGMQALHVKPACGCMVPVELAVYLVQANGVVHAVAKCPVHGTKCGELTLYPPLP